MGVVAMTHEAVRCRAGDTVRRRRGIDVLGVHRLFRTLVSRLPADR